MTTLTTPKFYVGQQVIATKDEDSSMYVIVSGSFMNGKWAYRLAQDDEIIVSVSELDIKYFLNDANKWYPTSGGSRVGLQ